MTARAVFALTFAATLGLGVGACSTDRTAKSQNPSAAMPLRRMPDGKEWTTINLSIDVDGSSCYGDSDANCRRYGRLYTWPAALKVCRLALGPAWRLPADHDWRA